MVLTQVSRFRFQDSGFRIQGLGRFVSVGANRIRPVFIFAIFILGSADAGFKIQVSRFRFQDSGIRFQGLVQVCCRWGESHSPCFCIRDNVKLIDKFKLFLKNWL